MPSWYKIFHYFCLFALVNIGVFIYMAISSDLELVAVSKVIAACIAIFFAAASVFLFTLNKTNARLDKFVIWGYVVLVIGSIVAIYGAFYDTVLAPFSDIILLVAVFSEKLVFTFALSANQYHAEDYKQLGRAAKLLTKNPNQAVAISDEKVSGAKAKQDFLAMLSHELRTPMNAIVGFTELLKDSEPTPDQAFYIENLDISNRNMLKMIDNLLYSMDLGNGATKLEQSPFDLHQLLQESIQAIQEINHNPHLHIQMTRAAYLPQEIIGDRRCLKLILQNLLDNAVKFTSTGMINLQVDMVTQSETEVCINFQVQDTGIGIPIEKQAIIFETFTQASDFCNRNFDGLGLGLPICKRLIELQGGNIELKSIVNKGTIFSFVLRFLLSDSSAEISF